MAKNAATKRSKATERGGASASLSRIERSILALRGTHVVIDADLAEFYGVSTKQLNQAIKRNPGKFPDDFAFRLTKEEQREVVTNCDHLKRLKFSPTPPRLRNTAF